MVVNKIERIEDYAIFLKSDKNEVHELYHDLLINVTNFFRDPEVFDTLRKKIYPSITKEISPSNPVRIWIPGCSTGEEVYSIAISLFEYLEKKSANYFIQIFATDISEPAIEKARSGYYPDSAIKELPKEFLRKYFSKVNGGYQINKTIRDLCIFARQDIAKDPPFSRIDLISCRNLLIYLSPALQKRIIPVFHYALKPGGTLLLGTSESIGSFADLFSMLDNKFKIYEKKQVGNKIDYRFDFSGIPPERNKIPQKMEIATNLDIQKEADRIILDHFSPPGVLINQNLDIIQIRGRINEYLEPRPGEASLNLFKMMKEGISLELHTSIRKAKKTGNSASVEDIVLSTNGTQKKFDLEVVPIKQTDSHEVFYLILFKERHEHPLVRYSKNPAGEIKKKKDKLDSKDIRYEKLKEELLITKDHLQSIIEEREVTNEELRSALEELQSSNEELQSTNEEMETTREELQSTNEELITVNDELEGRNSELNKINNDLNNLLLSVNIPIIMLSRDLKVRRYTPRAEKIWNLISGDIGRPIGNITPNILVDDLSEKIIEVIEHLDPKEIEVKDKENNWYSMKIRPYRTTDDKIDGVVITLFDVDKMKKEFDNALKGKNFSEVIFNTVREPLLILQKDYTIKEANRSFFSKFDFKREDVINKSIFEIGDREWDNTEFKNFIKQVKKDNTYKDFELTINNKTSNKLVINVEMFSDSGEDYILVAILRKD
jgi:two-component system CheB/CheR fusion protein